ncbi:MAG: alpha/beta hydrolase [Pseudomonadota bacterium]
MLTVYFGTNRNPNRRNKPDDFTDRLNAESPRELRYGKAFVMDDGRNDTESRMQIQVAPEALNPNRRGGPVLGSQTIFNEIRQKLSDRAPNSIGVLLYIHGFDYSFREAVGRTAYLHHQYGLDYVPVLFSWPSEGEKTPWRSYFRDREKARESGTALARGILKMRDLIKDLAEEERCDVPIHLMVHSMGGYALRQAVQGMRSEAGPRLDRLFHEIIMAAPDEDDDTFEHDHKLRPLIQLGRRITVYHCRTDRALQISDYTKGTPDRLGADGPKTGTMVPNRIEVVDCAVAAQGDGDFSDHQYYRESPSARADIQAVLKGELGDTINNRVFVPQQGSYRIVP